MSCGETRKIKASEMLPPEKSLRHFECDIRSLDRHDLFATTTRNRTINSIHEFNYRQCKIVQTKEDIKFKGAYNKYKTSTSKVEVINKTTVTGDNYLLPNNTCCKLSSTRNDCQLTNKHSIISSKSTGICLTIQKLLPKHYNRALENIIRYHLLNNILTRLILSLFGFIMLKANICASYFGQSFPSLLNRKPVSGHLTKRNVFGYPWTLHMIAIMIAGGLVQGAAGKALEDPHFGRPIVNVTAAVGREAILECVAEQLANYKVAWLRVDTQTILTIHSHVITKNHRIGVTHSEHRTWYLHIKEVKESDRGWYMCQINTDPMKSQVGYLDVVVPPDILDVETSTDLVVQEGANVSLRCAARGSPLPSIMWKRENSETIRIGSRKEVTSTMGSMLHISRVSRQQMGPYLCIASNGVPPSVSKRIMLVVHFPPIIWIQYQLIGAYDGQQIVLECNSEAYPKSINYWTGDKGQIIPHNEKFEPILMRDAYRVHMQLIIRDLQSADYGIYKCISKNSLGETDGTINVYRIPKPSTYNLTKSKNGARSRLITEEDTYHIADYQTDNPDSQHLDVGSRGSQLTSFGSSSLLSVLSLLSLLTALVAT